MSIDAILEKLNAEVKKPNFNRDLIQYCHSEGFLDVGIGTVWDYQSNSKYNGKYPKPEGEKWENKLANYVTNKWADFSAAFSDVAEMQSGKLKIYREIHVDAVEEFLDALNKSTTIQGFKGIGIYWSWDKNRAHAHFGSGEGHSVLLEGLVGINDINYKNTAQKSLTPLWSDDEAEIEVKAKADITIVVVHASTMQVKKLKSNNIWQGKVQIAATFKNMVNAKYKMVGIS